MKVTRVISLYQVQNELSYFWFHSSSFNFSTLAKKGVSNRSIKNYLKQQGLSDVEISVIPKNFIKRTSLVKKILIADPKVAKSISYTICSRLSGRHILEFDAGIGLMSEMFSQSTKNLRLYVNDKHLMIFLKNKFKDDSHCQVQVFDRSFTNLLAMIYDLTSDNEIQSYLSDIPLKEWNEDICVSLVTPITHMNYMKALISNLVTDNTFRQFGRPEYFFLLTNNIAKYLICQEQCNNRFLSAHFLFHIFFDVDVLLSDIPRTAFLPWPRVKKKNAKTVEKQVGEASVSCDNLYVLHAVPKVRMFEPNLSSDFLAILLTFTKTTVQPDKRIIPVFESYVPYCGPQLILEDNITVYTKFFEISPEKFYCLFKKLTEYPEFDMKMVKKDDSFETVAYGSCDVSDDV